MHLAGVIKALGVICPYVPLSSPAEHEFDTNIDRLTSLIRELDASSDYQTCEAWARRLSGFIYSLRHGMRPADPSSGLIRLERRRRRTSPSASPAAQSLLEFLDECAQSTTNLELRTE